MKYKSPSDQNELLPNLLELNTEIEISLSEFEGFLKAEIILSEKLNARTKFSANYILNLHKLSLQHLYSFAGKLRDVNISKGGFLFASAKYLGETMQQFDKEILSELPDKYSHKQKLIEDVARFHAELLFIHPFREGNGRTARMLANLMVRKQGYDTLLFEKINEREFEKYVVAVQAAAKKDYSKMVDLITSIFPN